MSYTKEQLGIGGAGTICQLAPESLLRKRGAVSFMAYRSWLAGSAINALVPLGPIGVHAPIAAMATPGAHQRPNTKIIPRSHAPACRRNSTRLFVESLLILYKVIAKPGMSHRPRPDLH